MPHGISQWAKTGAAANTAARMTAAANHLEFFIFMLLFLASAEPVSGGITCVIQYNGSRSQVKFSAHPIRMVDKFSEYKILFSDNHFIILEASE